MTMEHTSVFLTGAVQSAAVLLPLPRIERVGLEVRSVRFSRRTVTTVSDDKLIGLNHDLGIIGTIPSFSPSEPNAWFSMFFHSNDTDLTRTAHPTDYFDPPFLLAGPQAFFVLNQGVTDLGGVWMVSLYYTRRSVPALAWADLLDQTSFNRNP